MTIDKLDFWKRKGNYQVIENAKYTIWWSGVFCYEEGENDVINFADSFLERTLDFNSVIGWFRFVIYDKKESTWYFFGDNSNSQHFFYDEQAGLFSDSLLDLVKSVTRKVRPNYSAIAHLLNEGYTINKDTIVEGLFRTDKNCFYSFDHKAIKEFEKGLKSFSCLNRKFDSVSVLKPITSQLCDQLSAAVCTGGTDSRVVLSCLDYLRQPGVEYVLTGHEDNPDIKVATRIAKIQNKELNIIKPETNDTDWLSYAFSFSDGEYDVVLCYRHYLKALWEQKKGIRYEFGGLAGEFYKNVFCHPFLWFGKRKNTSFFCNTLLKGNYSKKGFLGKKVKEAELNNSERLMVIASSVEQEKTMLEKGNRIGFDILSWKSGALTNGYSFVATKIDPLMDRQLCAYASHDNCLSHSMHIWQRKQVKKYCKKLADIITDQGYSCSLNPFILLYDCIKKSIFYIDRVFNRIRRKIGLGFKSAEQRFWDSDYRNARESEKWKMSVRRCKELEILDQNTEDDKIPLNLTGWILLIGMMFNSDQDIEN